MITFHSTIYISTIYNYMRVYSFSSMFSWKQIRRKSRSFAFSIRILEYSPKDCCQPLLCICAEEFLSRSVQTCHNDNHYQLCILPGNYILLPEKIFHLPRIFRKVRETHLPTAVVSWSSAAYISWETGVQSLVGPLLMVLK